MNIISKLTLRHLGENRKRTIVTILGIATSTALISAILLGVFSFFKFFSYLSIQTDGNAHAAFYELLGVAGCLCSGLCLHDAQRCVYWSGT